MVVLIRAARVVAILLVAALTVSLIIGIGSPETGLFEKVVLAALIAGCVVLAAKITTATTVLQTLVSRR